MIGWEHYKQFWQVNSFVKWNYPKHLGAIEPQLCAPPPPSAALYSGPLGSLTSSDCSGEMCGRGNNSKSQLCVPQKEKKIRDWSEERFVCALPDPVGGFVNYSSLSHLFLAKTDPERWSDIHKTTVSGVVCPYSPLVSTYTNAVTHTAPPVPGAKQPTKSSYVAQRHMAFPVGLCSDTPSKTAVRGLQVD